MATDSDRSVAVSIVSHGHGAMVTRLIQQLLTQCPEVGQIILTCNVSEQLLPVGDDRFCLVENAIPKGFGANHNAAFRHCRCPYFCVLNPDIELRETPFAGLMKGMPRQGGVVVPLVLSPDGRVEDSVRYFPSVRSLARKVLGGHDGRYEIEPGQTPVEVDWVAGMFMLFRSEDFARLGGFDERYFLYYEDVNICARAWRSGMKVMVCPSVSVIHDARRESHRKWRYMRWHLASMFRFLASGLGSRS